jgi:hypothetical protein
MLSAFFAAATLVATPLPQDIPAVPVYDTAAYYVIGYQEAEGRNHLFLTADAPARYQTSGGVRALSWTRMVISEGEILAINVLYETDCRTLATRSLAAGLTFVDTRPDTTFTVPDSEKGWRADHDDISRKAAMLACGQIVLPTTPLNAVTPLISALRNGK